jgi:hypothetical protein
MFFWANVRLQEGTGRKTKGRWVSCCVEGGLIELAVAVVVEEHAILSRRQPVLLALAGRDDYRTVLPNAPRSSQYGRTTNVLTCNPNNAAATGPGIAPLKLPMLLNRRERAADVRWSPAS